MVKVVKSWASVDLLRSAGKCNVWLYKNTSKNEWYNEKWNKIKSSPKIL